MPEKAKIETHKRQKIEDSSRTMFMWVAGMAAVVGLFGVISWFVFQQAIFKSSVVGKKNETVTTLRQNNEAASQLRDNLRAFEANAALRSARINDTQNALSVIIDALPSSANSLALGASLQERLIKGVPNLTLEALTVSPTGPSLSGDAATTVSDPSAATGSNIISFRVVVVSTDPNSLKEVLGRFERSIRVIDIDSLGLERSDRDYTMTIDAHAYYEPAKVIELQEKVTTPNEKK